MQQEAAAEAHVQDGTSSSQKFTEDEIANLREIFQLFDRED